MNKHVQESDSTARGTAPLPAHEVIYRKLRAMVLFGDLAPGQAVTIKGLTDLLGAGMTPVREAIRRLIAEGALEFQGNRRVCVPEMTINNIDEFIFARQWLDPKMAELAAQSASADDIALLEAIDTELDSAIANGELRAYLELNYRFHSMIYALAETPILAELADGLWLRFGPLLRVVCGRLGTQNLPDQHKELIRAMAEGNTRAAATAMREDVTQGMEQVRDSLTNAENRR